MFWLHASGTDYQYDAAGNMTFDATASLSYTFDQENRLTGAAGYTYTYDADGNRVRKSNGNLARRTCDICLQHRPPVRMDTPALAPVRNAREFGLARANLADELIRY